MLKEEMKEAAELEEARNVLKDLHHELGYSVQDDIYSMGIEELNKQINGLERRQA